MCHLCRCELDPTTRGNLPTGVVSHIAALSDGGPRFDPSMTNEQRNTVENLMFLCPSCHSMIDKNSGRGFPTDELVEAKGRHESWTRSLRQAGSTWNVHFRHVDFVNLPRMAALSGGEKVHEAARRIGLDPNKAFREQGMLAGAFVRQVKMVFENWRELAVDLDPDSPVEVKPGMVVSFDSPMRARNIEHARALMPISGLIERDPHLGFTYGTQEISIRFDPVWLTTMTSLTTLGTAETEEVTYAGIGTVASVTDSRVQVSALAFGQPDNGNSTLFEMLLDPSSSPRSMEIPTTDSKSRREMRMPRQKSAREKVDVAFYFDELAEELLGPESLQGAMFRALLKAVPEHRRDLCVGDALLDTRPARGEGMGLASRLVPSGGGHWSSLDVPRLGRLIQRTELAYMRVWGVEPQYLDDIDEILREEFDPYLGGYQIVADNSAHTGLHDCSPQFRLRGAELSVLYSAVDCYNDGMDESILHWWQNSGLFSAVSWEEDEAQSQEDEKRAREILEGL
ncbi:hypothetical protein GCM10007147_13120 [Nocardiopsis kunsanensis]|uniref:HNH endonuclease n=2 Tax=Nocardiopsis kunsanensis TaxID=141693 RepID=A0A918XA37_9ACTN|nr:hypothetical protein GCM10007147_13120 [Nocardiopsis kunsanensis]